MTMRPRAIIFDWDNTLVDSWPTIHAALNATLTTMGHAPWTLEESKERVRLSLRDSFPVLFGTRWEEARRVYLDAFRAVHLERLTVLPGPIELLDHLADGFDPQARGRASRLDPLFPAPCRGDRRNRGQARRRPGADGARRRSRPCRTRGLVHR
jgi:hypothetical protein